MFIQVQLLQTACAKAITPRIPRQVGLDFSHLHTPRLSIRLVQSAL